FRRSVLESYIRQESLIDFGKEIIPDAIKRHKCLGHIFPGYWEDIGTIDAFFKAHMGMLNDPPVFTFNKPEWPTFTRPRFLPNINALHCNLENCRIAEGTVLKGATI